MLNLIFTIVPAILFCLLFYKLNKDREEINIFLLVLVFIFGGISSYLSYRLEWHFGSYFKKVAESNLFEVFFYAVFGVAVFEEGLKLFFTLIFSKLNKIKSLSSYIVYCVCASSGFLMIENLLFYSFKYGIGTTIRRLFTSVPSHLCFAIIMGVLLYNFKKLNFKSFLYLFLAFLVPTVVHAIYNTFLYQGISELFIYSYIFLLLIIIICILIVVKAMFYRERK